MPNQLTTPLLSVDVNNLSDEFSLDKEEVAVEEYNPDLNVEYLTHVPNIGLTTDITRTNRGSTGEFHFIPARNLRIDNRYQRKITGGRGRDTISSIVNHFDWAKFTPAIVVPVDEDNSAEFCPSKDIAAIVDGQHRTVAAQCVYGNDVLIPCYLHYLSFKEAALCFAAINGRTVPISKYDIFKALVASGDKERAETLRILTTLNVTPIGRIQPGQVFRPGETTIVTNLHNMRILYGSKVFRRAIACIRYTGDGNPGLINTNMVKAFCTILSKNPHLLEDDTNLLKGINTIDLREVYSRSMAQASATAGINKRTNALIANLFEEMVKVFN